MAKVLALTIPERETIIRALDDPPPGLESSARCCSKLGGTRRTFVLAPAAGLAALRAVHVPASPRSCRSCQVGFEAEQRGVQILVGIGLLVVGLFVLDALGTWLAKRYPQPELASAGESRRRAEADAPGLSRRAPSCARVTRELTQSCPVRPPRRHLALPTRARCGEVIPCSMGVEPPGGIVAAPLRQAGAARARAHCARGSTPTSPWASLSRSSSRRPSPRGGDRSVGFESAEVAPTIPRSDRGGLVEVDRRHGEPIRFGSERRDDTPGCRADEPQSRQHGVADTGPSDAEVLSNATLHLGGRALPVSVSSRLAPWHRETPRLSLETRAAAPLIRCAVSGLRFISFISLSACSQLSNSTGARFSIQSLTRFGRPSGGGSSPGYSERCSGPEEARARHRRHVRDPRARRSESAHRNERKPRDPPAVPADRALVVAGAASGEPDGDRPRLTRRCGTAHTSEFTFCLPNW